MRFETGTDLKKWRLEHHMTQKDLANRIGYTKDRISHIETDNEGNSILSKRLQISLTDLDNQINDKLIKTWRLRINNRNFMEFFSKEFIPLGNHLSEAINGIPKGFHSGVSYIRLLDCYVRTFLSVTHTSKDMNTILNSLITYSTKYRNAVRKTH